MVPVPAMEPANASPKPSRMDFLPNSITSGGISLVFCRRDKSANVIREARGLGEIIAGHGSRTFGGINEHGSQQTRREMLCQSHA